jgi:hypothetical protein
MERLAGQLSSKGCHAALQWILENAENPAAELEPEFDIDDQERKLAKKIRRLFKRDPSFWQRWIDDTGVMRVAASYLSEPLLVKHAAFIKRKADESYIPLHQDIVLWEHAYETAVTIYAALTESTKANGGMFYYPDARNVYTHGLDIRYPLFKCITAEADSRVKWTEVCDIDANAGDVLVWSARTAHGSHVNESGKLRVGMPLVFVERSEYLFHLEQRVRHWTVTTLSELFPGRAIHPEHLDQQLADIKNHSLKMVSFLARFSRQFSQGPKIMDFITSPTIATLAHGVLREWASV